MNLFEPIGDRARWRVLYEMLVKHDVGDVVSYPEMGAVLNLDPDADRHVIQMALRRAASEFLEVDKRAVDVIPNIGYRVVAAEEHMGLARRQQRRSNRALARGRSQVVNVNLNEVEPEARKAFEVMAQAFSMQMDFNRRMDVRQARLERAVHSMTTRHERTDDEVAELRHRLELLEGARTA